MRYLLPILCINFTLSSCGDLPVNEDGDSASGVELGSCLLDSVNPSESLPAVSFSMCLEFNDLTTAEANAAKQQCSEGSEDLNNAKGSWRETNCETSSATAQCEIDEYEGFSNKAYIYEADFNFVLSSSQGEGLCAEDSFEELVAPSYKTARVQISQNAQTFACFQLDQLTEFTFEVFQSQFSDAGLELEEDEVCETSGIIASCMEGANSLGVELSQYYYFEIYDQDDIDECTAEGGTWESFN